MGPTGTNAEPGRAAHYNLNKKQTHLDRELIATEDVSSNRYMRKRGHYGDVKDRGAG